jgi:hypothetical protein
MDEALDQLRTELAEMRATMERQQSRIAELESAVPAPPGGGKLRSRRQVLKLAGATIAGAAAGIAGSAVPALAATGGNAILGASGNTSNANLADQATEFQYTGTASQGVGLLAQIGAVFTPSAAAYPAALAGWTTASHTPNGVYGWTNQPLGKGVVGVGPTAGVQGSSSTGYGGLFALGKSQVRLVPAGSAGAPAPAGHLAGELYVDSAGILYVFTAGAFFALSSTNMLAAPIRLLESRPAYQDNVSPGQTKPGRRINNGEIWDIPITGQVIGSTSIPAGATAVIGNVTVTNPTVSGFLTLYPFGATAPNTSSINFTPGATVANGVTVGLSAAGHMAIKGAGSTDIIFDAAGYIM